LLFPSPPPPPPLLLLLLLLLPPPPPPPPPPPLVEVVIGRQPLLSRLFTKTPGSLSRFVVPVLVLIFNNFLL
jgi:hypothetical protein